MLDPTITASLVFQPIDYLQSFSISGTAYELDCAPRCFNIIHTEEPF